jgi:hypothetical protein
MGDLAQSMDIVVCPPCTGLYAFSPALEGSSILLG